MEWIQPLVQFGLPTVLLVAFVYVVKGWIETNQRTCEEHNTKLAQDVKDSNTKMIEILEKTITESNVTRIRQSDSFDRLTKELIRILPTLPKEI